MTSDLIEIMNSVAGQIGDQSEDNILKAYLSADYARNEAHYEALVTLLPETAETFKMHKEGYNPVELLSGTKVQIEGFKAIQVGILPLLDQVDCVGQEKELAAVKSMFGTLGDMFTQFDLLSDLSIGFYSSLVENARVLATENDITPIEVVQNGDYMDQINKNIFPNRTDAETFYNITVNHAVSMMDMARGMITAVSFLDDSPEMEEAKKSLPSTEVVESYKTIQVAFFEKELDRIYKI